MILRENYKDVQQFLKHHKRARQNCKGTLDNYEYQLRYALKWCDSVPFGEFQKVKMTFPEFLRVESDNYTKMSETSCADICALTREFFRFQVSENQARYKNIKESDIDMIRINVTSDSTKTAKYYSLDEMEKIVKYQPETLALKRAKAGACFLFLSGARISAFVSMPVECVNLQQKTVYQFPDYGVVTKFSKKAITTLLPIPSLLDVVREWENILTVNNIPSNALWYSRIDRSGSRLLPDYPIPGNHDEAYKKARHDGTKFREDLQRLCTLADVEYKNPHAFRHGHVHYGLSRAKTLEQAKAISQNVMHASTAVTDELYSRMTYKGVSDIISNLGDTGSTSSTTDVKQLLSGMTDEDKKALIKELLGL